MTDNLKPAEFKSTYKLPKPKPSAGIEAYEREKELALSHDPRRTFTDAKL